MRLIEKVRYYLWERKMHGLLRNRKVERKMLSIKNAKNIGIYAIYKDAEYMQWLTQLANSLKERGANVCILLYVDDKQKPKKILENSYLGLFCKSEVKFDYVPNVRENPYLLSFLEQPFDILFDLSLDFHYQGVAVMLLSKAQFVIGKGGEWGNKVNDLSFSPTETMDVRDFYAMVQNYLKNIQFND